MLEHGLALGHNDITNCCMYYSNDSGNILFSKAFWKKGFSLDSILEQKKKIKENAKNNIFPDGCLNCPNLTEKEWEDNSLINYLIITHWTKCNCGCIYCYFDSGKKYFQKFKNKSVLPLLKEMAKRKMFAQDTIITIIGGEIGELKEFDELMRFCLRQNFAKIIVNSSCIKYKSIISEGLKQDKVEFIMSLDSGNKELYKKIKRVNKFDTVVNNLRRYANAQNLKKNMVCVKYIILPKINDTEEQIGEWAKLCSDIGIKHIIIDIETSYFMKNQNKLPKYIYDLISFTEKKAEELNLELSYHAHAAQIKHDMRGIFD